MTQLYQIFPIDTYYVDTIYFNERYQLNMYKTFICIILCMHESTKGHRISIIEWTMIEYRTRNLAPQPVDHLQEVREETSNANWDP